MTIPGLSRLFKRASVQLKQVDVGEVVKSLQSMAEAQAQKIQNLLDEGYAVIVTKEGDQLVFSQMGQKAREVAGETAQASRNILRRAWGGIQSGYQTAKTATSKAIAICWHACTETAKWVGRQFKKLGSIFKSKPQETGG